MYPRLLKVPGNKSFFLFGPRGTGKTTWVKKESGADVIIDLLDGAVYQELIGQPARLRSLITPSSPGLIVIDEIQRIPGLLNEVHRLIEEKKWRFALTGSSARKLRKTQANLLAGRAYDYRMHPLTVRELGRNFSLPEALRWGLLPAVSSEPDKGRFLKSYVSTYVREEVQQEGLARNIPAFARFMEAASFSQGSVLNLSSVARDAGKDRKVVEDYFSILEDLLIGVRLPVFQKKAKRSVTVHPKFYYFDVGVFRAVRPLGPLDDAAQLNGIALETLVFQQLRALNDYCGWGFELFFWRTTAGEEVDFVLYGEKGLVAIEVTSAGRYRLEDGKALRAFSRDYPMARSIFLYSGDREYREEKLRVVPVAEFLQRPRDFLF